MTSYFTLKLLNPRVFLDTVIIFTIIFTQYFKFVVLGFKMMKNPETMEEIVRNWPNQSAEIAEYICQNHGGLKDLHCGEFPITHTW